MAACSPHPEESIGRIRGLRHLRNTSHSIFSLAKRSHFLCPARLLIIVTFVLWVMSIRHRKFLTAWERDACSGAAEELAV